MGHRDILQYKKTKKKLDKLYNKYNRRKYVHPDPIRIPIAAASNQGAGHLIPLPDRGKCVQETESFSAVDGQERQG